MIYLDWAATAVPDAQAQENALKTAITSFGNASSSHGCGSNARALLESARRSLGDLLCGMDGTTASTRARMEIAFTGSGTEADQIPLLALLSRPARGTTPHIVVSSIEHSAIHAQARLLEKIGIEVSFVDPESDGIVRPDRIIGALRPSTRLVCLMAVNNETGAIQRVEETASGIESWALSGNFRMPQLHVDYVQALGKIPFALPLTGLSSAAFSAHKLGGPKGIGALAYRSRMEVLAQGGGQEKGMRSGTENLFGALAFAEVARKARTDLEANLARARKLMERLLTGMNSISGTSAIPRCRQPVDPAYSPWIASLAFPGLSGEVLARALSDAGIAVSTGSACSQAASAGNKNKGRRILEAMGVPSDVAFGTIRVSIGRSTRSGDIDQFLETASALYRRLKT